jgi:hypothetical protein
MGKNISVYLNDDDVKLFEASGLTIGHIVSQALKAYGNDTYKVIVSYRRSSKLRERLLVAGKVAPERLIEKTFEIASISQDVVDYAKSQGLFYAENCTYTYPHRSIESFGVFLDKAIVKFTDELDQDIDEFNLTVETLKEVQAQYEEREKEKAQEAKEAREAREARELERANEEKERLQRYEKHNQEKADAVNKLISKLNLANNDDLKVIAQSEYKTKFMEELILEYLQQSGLKIACGKEEDFAEIDGIEEIGVKKAREAILARQKIEALLATIELIDAKFNSFVKADTGVLGYEYKIEFAEEFKEYYIFLA